VYTLFSCVKAVPLPYGTRDSGDLTTSRTSSCHTQKAAGTRLAGEPSAVTKVMGCLFSVFFEGCERMMVADPESSDAPKGTAESPVFRNRSYFPTRARAGIDSYTLRAALEATEELHFPGLIPFLCRTKVFPFVFSSIRSATIVFSPHPFRWTFSLPGLQRDRFAFAKRLEGEVFLLFPDNPFRHSNAFLCPETTRPAFLFPPFGDCS